MPDGYCATLFEGEGSWITHLPGSPLPFAGEGPGERGFSPSFMRTSTFGAMPDGYCATLFEGEGSWITHLPGSPLPFAGEGPGERGFSPSFMRTSAFGAMPDGYCAYRAEVHAKRIRYVRCESG